MANFTQSIREILQQNKLPNESLLSPTDVYNIAVRTLFDAETPTGVISDDYREQFITGFTLHFMNDEIGYETLPLWKIALNEKLYNNATYINKIFENLDKEIFADYHVKNAVNTGSKSGAKSLDGSVSNDRNILSSGSDNTIQSFDDTVSDSKADARTKGGYDEVEKSGSELRQRGGKDTLEKKGAESSVNTGRDTNYDNSVQDNVYSGASGNYTNAIQINSDTPMGSLQNLRTPGGALTPNNPTTAEADPVGTPDPEDPIVRDFQSYEFEPTGTTGRGFDYEEHQTYNYMTGAAESGQTVQNVDNNNERTIGQTKNEVTHGLKTTTLYGVDSSGESPVTEGKARQDETSYDSDDSLTYGKRLNATRNGFENDPRRDKTSYNSTDNLLSSGTSHKTGSDTTEKTNSSATNDYGTQTTLNNEMTSESNAGTANEVDHTLNWEMLYKSMPLLNKVWEIFDDLFMIIF